MGLFNRKKAIKEVDTDAPKEVKLKKQIGVLHGVGIIVGVIVGSGIFVSPVGVLKHTNSVGLSLILWLVTGLFSALGAIVYAELGVTIPRSGGEYIYILKTFGNLPAFACLWINFVAIGSVSLAANSLIFAEYVIKPFFPDCVFSAYLVQILAIVGVMSLCAVHCFNVKWAANVAVIFSVCKVFALVIIVVIGFITIGKGNVTNFQDPFENSKFEAGPMAIAFYQGFWAYAGWNYLNFLTAEMKNPGRNLPIAIIISLLLVTTIYLLANVAYLAVLSPQLILATAESSAAVAVTFADKTMGVMAFIMPIFVGASVFGSMNGEILSMSRVTFTGAQEGHMPSILAMVSYKYLTPMPSVILLSVLSLIFQFFDVFYLIELTGIAFCIMSAMATCSLLYLRYKFPDMKKDFKLPIVVPILFLILDLYIGALTVYQQPYEALISLGIMFSGIPVYWLGVSWKSKPKSVVRTIDRVTTAVQKLLLVVPEESILFNEDMELEISDAKDNKVEINGFTPVNGTVGGSNHVEEN